MTMIVLAMALASMLVGEKVQAGGGLGWDGVTYARLVRGLGSVVGDGKLSSYYAQRLMPAALVRAALLAFHQPLTNASIIHAFEIYNAILALIATLLWTRIADRLQLGIAARWIGFSALFINFAFSKQDFFYPVLTDMTAYVAGFLLLMFALERRRGALLATTTVAAFCWPIAVPSGALLLLLCHTRGEVLWGDTDSVSVSRWRDRRTLLAIACVALAIYLGAVTLAVSGLACPVVDHLLAQGRAVASAAMRRRLVLLDGCRAFGSLLTAVPMLLLVGSGVFRLALFGLQIRKVWAEARRIRAADYACSGLSITIPLIGVKLLSSPTVPNPSSLLLLVRLGLFPTEGMAFMPLVSLGAFWGPAVLVICLRWADVSRAARRLGPGFVALLCFNIPFAIVGEPRFMTLAWPFLVVLMVCALDARSIRRGFGYAFAALSVFLAQFWLKINYVRWLPDNGKDLLAFPKQLYFMHYGLWMGWFGYLTQATILLIASGSLWAASRPRLGPEPARS